LLERWAGLNCFNYIGSLRLTDHQTAGRTRWSSFAIARHRSSSLIILALILAPILGLILRLILALMLMLILGLGRAEKPQQSTSAFIGWQRRHPRYPEYRGVQKSSVSIGVSGAHRFSDAKRWDILRSRENSIAGDTISFFVESSGKSWCARPRSTGSTGTTAGYIVRGDDERTSSGSSNSRRAEIERLTISLRDRQAKSPRSARET
jgi:hypothetical protein